MEFHETSLKADPSRSSLIPLPHRPTSLRESTPRDTTGCVSECAPPSWACQRTHDTLDEEKAPAPRVTPIPVPMTSVSMPSLTMTSPNGARGLPPDALMNLLGQPVSLRNLSPFLSAARFRFQVECDTHQ